VNLVSSRGRYHGDGSGGDRRCRKCGFQRAPRVNCIFYHFNPQNVHHFHTCRSETKKKKNIVALLKFVFPLFDKRRGHMGRQDWMMCVTSASHAWTSLSPVCFFVFSGVAKRPPTRCRLLYRRNTQWFGLLLALNNWTGTKCPSVGWQPNRRLPYWHQMCSFGSLCWSTDVKGAVLWALHLFTQTPQ